MALLGQDEREEIPWDVSDALGGRVELIVGVEVPWCMQWWCAYDV